MLEMKLITKRFDKINPLSIDDYIKYDGYEILKKAFLMDPKLIVEEITKSRLSANKNEECSFRRRRQIYNL